MCIYPDAISVTLFDSEPFVSLTTYDQKHGKSQRFFLSKKTLMNQLCDDAEGSITEVDLLNVCTVTHAGNSIRFKMLWLHGNYDNDVCGYQQSFTIPFSSIRDAISGRHVKCLAYSPTYRPKASIYLTPTVHTAIAKASKLERHAIRKFFRDHFDYGKEENLVIQQDEWIKGFFFFSTISRYEGGIALHTSDVKGKDGKLHQKLYFGLHT